MGQIGAVEHVGSGGEEGRAAWSIVETRIGEAIGFVPSLRCFPRTWARRPPAWSVESGEMRAVRVESVAFSERFDARVQLDQEENWLLQLLSPDFITWLTDAAQEQFGFELQEGILRAFSPGHLDGAAAERLRDEAAFVADRVRAEALESEGLGVRELGSGVPLRIERALADVHFESPPPDSRTASIPFRRFAARDPRVYLAALGTVVTTFVALSAALLEVGLDFIDVIVAVISWIGPQGTSIGVGTFIVAAWIAAIPEAIKIASHTYGRVAFAREYARARGHALESPQSFHRRLMRVDLPAPAQLVFRGILGEREGWLVLCRSGRALLHSYFDAAVFAAPGAATASGTQGGLAWAIDDGHLIVSRSSGADRSAARLDSFTSRASAVCVAHERGELSGGPNAAAKAVGASAEVDQLDGAEG